MKKRNVQTSMVVLVCKRCGRVWFGAPGEDRYEHLNTLSLGRVGYQRCDRCAAHKTGGTRG